ncbi:TonB-dependent receptor plug domain-containing protein [Labilibacter marinus]|uniref:TonB-dependent receptor plug domain-containing protein n=1 Tax=Labilibacter marinus TaxID=1477105 RepID=UPI000830AF6C|nr:TonB-dependent receptor [Labilibacter marinus]
MLRVFGALLVIIWSIGANAQSNSNVVDFSNINFEDTVHILEVEIVSPVSKKYQVGSKTQEFTPMQKIGAMSGSLTDLITKFSPVYIKSDAGGLGSFRFRGTSSTHTSVLIGELNINSLTLGSSNTSNIPTFLFDNINLAFGSSSASTGSGSIGGSVRLGFNHNWTKGVHGEAFTSMGSFGEYVGGAKVFVGNGKFESVTRLVYYQKENNFSYENTEYYDYEQQKYRRDTLKNSSIKNQNILQEINYKIDNNQQITSFFWLGKNRHEAQPNMTQNNSSKVRPIEDINFRSWVNYRKTIKKNELKIGAGYVNDKAIDNGDEVNTIGTQRFVSHAGYKGSLFKLNYEANINYRYIKPKVYAYDKTVTEENLDLHAALLYRITPKLKASLNMRQQFVTRFDAPFTPSLGLDYILHTDDHSLIRLIANAQKTYKIPTFNDRYWGQEGYEGNENILPEEGLSYEAGAKYTLCSDKVIFNFSSNVYYMDVDNWIQWIPNGNFWSAQNILRVISKGIEVSTDANFSIKNIKIQTGANYAYNSATRKESSLETDILGRQLEYTPQHIANAFISGKIRKTSIGIDGSFCGERYYNQVGDYLNAYKLINISASHKFNIKDNDLLVDFQVNNIFNEVYQNQYQYAMPESNYRVLLKYKF